MCLHMMDAVFDDKRIIVVFLVCWLTLVLVVFEDLGMMNTKFMALGPSPTTVFMGVTLDSWYKWGLVAAFTFINTAVNDFNALGKTELHVQGIRQSNSHGVLGEQAVWNKHGLLVTLQACIY